MQWLSSFFYLGVLAVVIGCGVYLFVTRQRKPDHRLRTPEIPPEARRRAEEPGGGLGGGEGPRPARDASGERPVNYLPPVESMNQVAGAPLGAHHTVLLFDEIKSAGSVEYAFLAVVFENATQQPVFYVASEVNATAAVFGGGSHFLGVFEGQVHSNCGASDDWGNPEKFFPEALRIAQERFAARPSEE